MVWTLKSLQANREKKKQNCPIKLFSLSQEATERLEVGWRKKISAQIFHWFPQCFHFCASPEEDSKYFLQQRIFPLAEELDNISGMSENKLNLLVPHPRDLDPFGLIKSDAHGDKNNIQTLPSLVSHSHRD